MKGDKQMFIKRITFPSFTGLRCLMMPYIQGEPSSVPDEYQAYAEIIQSAFFKQGAVGYLTIDESMALMGTPHRGARAKTHRALHTEAGRHPDMVYAWGGGGWGKSHRVTLDGGVEVLLANNLDDSCALWDATHEHTSIDGDIGHEAAQYPYGEAVMMKA